VGELGILDGHGGTDIRRVQGASCNDVVQALSLTAALALDPNALLSAPATTVVPAATMTAAPAGDPSTATSMNPEARPTDKSMPTPAVKPATEGRPMVTPPIDDATPAAPATVTAAALPTVASMRSWDIAVHTVGVGLLSGRVSPGFMLAVRRTLPGEGAFRPALGLAIAYARNDLLQNLLQSPGPAQVSLASLAGTVCPLRWKAGRFALQPCALLLAGRLSASGREVVHSYQVEHLWLSAGAGLRAAADLGRRVSFELDAALTIPLFKRQFYSTVPSNVVAKTPTVSPIVGVGLTYSL
jgi:hypothetical protein